MSRKDKFDNLTCSEFVYSVSVSTVSLITLASIFLGKIRFNTIATMKTTATQFSENTFSLNLKHSYKPFLHFFLKK